MHGSKMCRMSADMEHKHLSKNTKDWIYMSEMRSKKRKAIAEEVIILLLELFYTFSVTYFVGRWAINAAYLERGYKAYGGEYLVILFTIYISFTVVSKFFDSIRR